MVAKVKKFIEENIQLIENEDWELVEKAVELNLYGGQVGEFYYAMLEAGINPIKGFDHLPNNFLAGSPITTYSVDNNIKIIRADAFKYCKQLKHISIPEGVIAIGQDAFSGCESLEKLKLPESLSSFTADNLWSGMGEVELILPSKTTLEDFLKPIKGLYDVYRLKVKDGYTINIQGTLYTMEDLVKKAMDNINKAKAERKSRIPDLYRIQTPSSTLQTTTFDKKQGAMRVRFVSKMAAQGFNCPLFFLSEKEAQDFVDAMKGSVVAPGPLKIYKAQLSYNDTNFTEIKTLYGNALIQSWKDNHIDTSCIIKKNVF